MNVLPAAKQHLRHSLEWKGPKLGVLEMRRHYTNYFRGYRGVKQFRQKLVMQDDPSILFEILDQIEETYATNEELIMA